MRIAIISTIGSFAAMVGASSTRLTIPNTVIDSPYGPLVSVENYNDLRGLPTLPNQPQEVPLSFFINQLERVVREAIRMAPNMSADRLIAIAKQVDPKYLGVISSYDEFAVEIAQVYEAASNNPWTIFEGREIFRLCGMFWDVHSHIAHLVVEALFAIPYSSPEEARNMSELIGFYEFAARNSQWILFTFFEDFERIQLLLGEDFEVLLEPFVEPIGERELEDIRTGAAQILNASGPDDILVFLGNAASYYYYALEGSERRSLLVPFDRSGDADNPSDMEHFDRFEQVYLDPIRREARESGKTVLVVGVTHTCEAVDQFTRLLTYRRCRGCRIELLQILTDASTDAATDYEAPRNIGVRALIHPINGSCYGFLGSSHPSLVPFFPALYWKASKEGMVAFYASRGSAHSEISKIRSYIASKGRDWPHADCPMIDDVAAYHEMVDFEGDVPRSLPLFYWTDAVVGYLEMYSDKEPTEEVLVSELESKPIESMAQLAYRLNRLGSNIHQYFRQENHVDQSHGSESGSDDGNNAEEIYEWEVNSAASTNETGGSTSSSENDDESETSIHRRESMAQAAEVWRQLGYDIFNNPDDDSSRSSMSESDFGGSHLGDWAFELIDLARQNDYVRGATMPALAPFAERFPAIKTMISIAFGEEGATTATHI